MSVCTFHSAASPPAPDCAPDGPCGPTTPCTSAAADTRRSPSPRGDQLSCDTRQASGSGGSGSRRAPRAPRFGSPPAAPDGGPPPSPPEQHSGSSQLLSDALPPAPPAPLPCIAGARRRGPWFPERARPTEPAMDAAAAPDAQDVCSSESLPHKACGRGAAAGPKVAVVRGGSESTRCNTDTRNLALTGQETTPGLSNGQAVAEPPAPDIMDIYSPLPSPRTGPPPPAGHMATAVDPAITLRTHSPATVQHHGGAADQRSMHSTLRPPAFPAQHESLALLPLEPSRGGGGNSSSGSDLGAPAPPHPAQAGHRPPSSGGRQVPPGWTPEQAAAAMATPLMLGGDGAAAAGAAHMLPMHEVAAQLSDRSSVLDPLLGALSANPMHAGMQQQLEAGRGGSGRQASGGPEIRQHAAHPGRGPPGMASQDPAQLEWRQESGGRVRPEEGQQSLHRLQMPAAAGGHIQSQASMDLAALVADQGAQPPLMAAMAAEGQMFDAREQGRMYAAQATDTRGAHSGGLGWDSPVGAGGTGFSGALAMSAGGSMMRGNPPGQALAAAMQPESPHAADVMHAVHASSPRGFERAQAEDAARRATQKPTSGHLGHIGRTASGAVVTAENLQGSDANMAPVTALTNARMGFFPSSGSGEAAAGGAAAAAAGDGGRMPWHGAAGGGGSSHRSNRRRERQRQLQRGSDAEYVAGDEDEFGGSEDEDDDEWEGDGRGNKRQRRGGHGEGAGGLGGSGSGSDDPHTPAGGKYGGKLSETERRERRRKSNRESARRSRQRRMQEAKECEDRIAALNQNSLQLARQLEESRRQATSLSGALHRSETTRDLSMNALTNLLETIITDARGGMHVSQRLAAAVHQAQQALRRNQEM